MAGWCSDSESEDEPLNFNLFARKSFGFIGLGADKEIKLRNIVKQVGALCDDLPKYVFTTSEYYDTLSESNSQLYNVTFIRDCVDANRCLNIELYKLGNKSPEKKDYRDFDPCCNAILHNEQEVCEVCSHTFKSDGNSSKQSKKNDGTDSPMSCEKDDLVSSRQAPIAWELWEIRMLLDYIICNDAFFHSKSPSLFKQMHNEGYLTHRTPESMRVYFRKKILKSIDSYDFLPKPIVKIFKQVRDAGPIAKRRRFKTNLNRFV